MEKTISSNIANVLSSLPKKILQNKNYPILQECILYELANEQCLNFTEVAYFVYNPDFHLCKGLSGIKSQELVNTQILNHWDHSSQFETTINQSAYNKLIKNTEFCTLFSDNQIDLIINEIKKSLELTDSQYFTWHTNNNNIGILIYTSQNSLTQIENKMLEDATALLSFCPLC